MLSKAVGETVKVRPMVALPGWLVNREVKDAEVVVLSGKEIPDFFSVQISMLTFLLRRRG